MSALQKISPFLWYDNQAADAAKFYTSIFPNSKILSQGQLVTDFVLDGQNFQALNGGPKFKFNESVSFVIHCKDQKEVDYYWDSLTVDGGEESMCGWLKDKFGLSWQVIPIMVMQRINEGEPTRTEKMLNAVWAMRKLNIAELEKAYNS